MKRTYKDLDNGQLADLHRAALGLSPATAVQINRSCEDLSEYPFIATRTMSVSHTVTWWIDDSTVSVSDTVLTLDYIAAAGKAREFGLVNDFHPFEEEDNDLPWGD